MDKLLLEVKLGLLCEHPNIAKVYDAFVDHDNFYIVKEYLE